MFNSVNFNFKILSVFKLSWDEKLAFASSRPYHALSFRIKGDATFTSGDNKYHVTTNDLVYVPKGCEYTLKVDKSETVLVIHFDMIGADFHEISTFTPVNAAIFHELFEKTYKTWNKRGVAHEYKMASYFYNILANIELQEVEKLHRAKRSIDDILDYIGSNFSNPTLTVEHLSEIFGLSTVYIRKLFKENLNTTPLKYINERRIQYASSLLSIGYYSVREVSELSGFSDVKYFSTCFKKHMGISPSAEKTNLSHQSKPTN